MKHLLLVALVAASFSGLANANNGVYASIKAGISDMKIKDNEVHYSYHKDDFYSYEDYYQNNESKTIYPNISVAIGFDFSQISNVNVRTELEYTYKDSSTFKPVTNYEVWTNNYTHDTYPGRGDKKFSNKLQSQSLMLNGYYDFKNTSKFTPYISAGVGITRIKNDYINLPAPDYNLSDSDNHFSWSAGVGVAYAVTKNVDLDLSYKYVDSGKFKFNLDYDKYRNEFTQFKLNSQDYSLGIRYSF